MSQLVHRANLSAASFPFISTLHGQTVIVRGQDTTYNPAVTSKEDADKDAGIPQIYYAHNVLPHAQGFLAVGYDTDKIATAVVTFTSVHLIKDSTGNKGYIAFTSTGDFYTLQDGDTVFTWRLSVAAAAGKAIYVTHISGVSYIYVANTGCYTYDFTTHVVSAVTLTGLTAANVIGVCAASGYLLAWTVDTLAWSSLVDPTDFTPSLATGAGSGSIEGVKGKISFCMAFSLGFYVCTTGNVVVALASGNVRYPFIYKEVAGSGGVKDPKLASFRSNTAAQYLYTTSGLQVITPQGANTVFPEVVDFLAGQQFEDFDETSNTLSQANIYVTMKKAIAVISDRYVVISYGVSELTHALVYDLIMKRWGKLKVTHVDCFEYQLLDPETVESAKKGVAFLLKDGSIKILSSSLDSRTASGVMILGKFQYVRARNLQLHEVTIENITFTDNFQLYDMPTLDGKTFLPTVEGVLSNTPDLIGVYKFRVTGKNHSLLFKGAFHAVSVGLTFSLHGAR